MYISGHFSQINDPALSEELELLLANILGRVHFGSLPLICFMKLPLNLISAAATRLFY